MKNNFCFIFFLAVINILPVSASVRKKSVEIIRYSVTCSVRDGKLISDYDMEVQINSRAGLECADIAIAVNGTERIKNIEVLLTDTTGKLIRVLDKGEVVTANQYEDTQYYSDRKIKKFSARWNSYPYRFRYTYRIEQKEFFLIVDWSPFGMHGVDKVREASLVVSFPLDYGVRIRQQSISPASESLTGKLKSIEWRTTGLERGDINYGDYREDELPNVAVVPESFRFGAKGSWTDWDSYASYIRSMNGDAFDLPPMEQQYIQAVCRGAADPLEKIERAFDYLRQHTRYVNITFETGGIKPWPASWTSRNKYGDCKALTVYFLSLLQALDINGEYALIRSGTPMMPVDTSFPSQQFNHVIARIPLSDTVVWVDATSPLPLSHLPVSDRNRASFVVGEAWNGFRNTPGGDAHKPLRASVFHFSFNGEGLLQAKARITFSGVEYEKALVIRTLEREARKQQYAEKLCPLEGFELTRWEMPDDNFAIKPEKVMEAVYQSNMTTLAGKTLVVMTVPAIYVDDLLDFREHPISFQLDYPLHYTDTLVYHLPKGYTAYQVPHSTTISESGFVYDFNVLTDNQSLTVIRSLHMKNNHRELLFRENLRKFLDKMRLEEKNAHFVISKTNLK